MKDLPLAGSRLGFFGKGGAGKSTVVVLLARTLRELGYRVVVLDADSTNVGLARALGIEQPPDPLLERFGGMVFSGGAVTCPVDDPTPLPGASIDLAELEPRFAVQSPDGIHLLVAGKLGELGPGAGCDGPIAKIARDFRLLVPEGNSVTLVDFKAGFEDSARGGITSLDWALVVVDPTVAALGMAKHLTRMVRQMRSGTPPATRHLADRRMVEMAERQFRNATVQGVLAVLNRLPNREVESYLRQQLAREGPDVIGALEEDPDIRDLWLRGRAVESRRLAAPVLEMVEGLDRVTRHALAAH
jgi:CO dehydrogenase nickel-insertion accessory protein CooC1